jgi:hypothetical protein
VQGSKTGSNPLAEGLLERLVWEEARLLAVASVSGHGLDAQQQNLCWSIRPNVVQVLHAAL